MKKNYSLMLMTTMESSVIRRLLLIIITTIAVCLHLSALTYSKYLKVGESYTCRPNITTYGRSYSWSVSGNSGGALSISGAYSGSRSATVRAVKPGWAIITCDGYSKDGKNYYYDIWEITVEDNKPTAVSISPGSSEVIVGTSVKINAVVSPSGAEYSYITWASSNSSVASVSGTGTSATVRGVAVGEATISATTDNGARGVCTIKVWDGKAQSITLKPNDIELIEGESTTVEGTISPNNASFDYITWTSDNQNVATVSRAGSYQGYPNELASIKAVGKGTTYIRAVTDNGKSASCKVQVYGNNPTSMTVTGPSTLNKGSSAKFEATFLPDGQRSKVSWSSSNSSVGYFSSTNAGMFYANAYGSTIITALSANGLKMTRQLTVTVPELAKKTSFPANNATGQSQEDNPYVAFNQDVQKGEKWNMIALYKGGTYAEQADGKAVLSAYTFNQDKVEFVLDDVLDSLTSYRLFIPAGAVIGEDGVALNHDITVDFRTGSMPAMRAQVNLWEGKYYSVSGNRTDSEVYYTTDGTRPNKKSKRYVAGRIYITKDETVWCRAYQKGYYPGEDKREFRKDAPYVMASYPASRYDSLAAEYKPYVVKDVNPYWEFDIELKEGPNFKNLSLHPLYSSWAVPKGEFLISGKRIVFVPDQPLTRDEGCYSITSGPVFQPLYGSYGNYILGESVVTSKDGIPNHFYSAGLSAAFYESLIPKPATMTGVEILDTTMNLQIGERSVVLAKPIPVNADYTRWDWSSSNETVVSVTERGVIMGLNNGVATITLTSDYGYSASCTVYVGTASSIRNTEYNAKFFDVFDATGRKVRSAATSLKDLPKGIYIINKRSVIIR